LAQFERSIIRERTNAGLKAALARGRKGGRRPTIKPDDIKAALEHFRFNPGHSGS
jgi:DNA invertase Pin-like site-specific DNA recombinase